MCPPNSLRKLLLKATVLAPAFIWKTQVQISIFIPVRAAMATSLCLPSLPTSLLPFFPSPQPLQLVTASLCQGTHGSGAGIWSCSLTNSPSPPLPCHHLPALPSHSSAPCLGKLLLGAVLESPERGSRACSREALHNKVPGEAVIAEQRFGSSELLQECVKAQLGGSRLLLPAACACQESQQGWQEQGPELGWSTGLALAAAQPSCFHLTRSKTKPTSGLGFAFMPTETGEDFRPGKPPTRIPCLPSSLAGDQQH